MASQYPSVRSIRMPRLRLDYMSSRTLNISTVTSRSIGPTTVIVMFSNLCGILHHLKNTFIFIFLLLKVTAYRITREPHQGLCALKSDSLACHSLSAMSKLHKMTRYLTFPCLGFLLSQWE